MDSNATHGIEPVRGDAFDALRRLSRKSIDGQRCELCSAELTPSHPHLLHFIKRQVVCSCDACALLFCGQTGTHYLRIPRRVRSLPDFSITDLQWESMMLPINLAFFFRDHAASKVMAYYPSPAGAMESLLSLECWSEIEQQNPAVKTMESNVEALLVNRLFSPAEYFILPIDECYRLTGLIRIHWRGLSGGAEVWREVREYFANLRTRCGTTGATLA
jgi:Family of unknown function (DUF5947)